MTTRLRTRPGAPDAEVVAAGDPSDPAAGARAAAAVAVLAVVVALLGLPAGDLLTGPSFATHVAGPLEVDRGGGWAAAAEGATIGDGDRVRAAGGEVTLDPGGGRLVLGTGAQAVVDGAVLAIDRGSVLVDDDEPRSLRVDSVVAVGQGAWRIDRGAPSRVAAYAGEVTVADAGRQLTVPAHRQVSIRDRAIDAATLGPLRYLAADPFDQEVMAAALRVDGLAAALGRSLDGTYGVDPRPRSFFAAFAPDDLDGGGGTLDELAPTRDGDLLGPPAEVLIGVAVADAVATVADRAVDEVVGEVADLRRRGATWGLIVVAAGAGADGFTTASDRLLTRAATGTAAEPDATPDVAVADVDAPTAASPSPPAASDDVPDRGGTDGPTAPAPPGRGSGPRPGDPPAAPPPAPPPPAAPPTAPPLGPLEPVLDEVGRGLDEVGRGLGEAIEGTAELVEDVLGGVDELLQLPFTGGGGVADRHLGPPR